MQIKVLVTDNGRFKQYNLDSNGILKLEDWEINTIYAIGREVIYNKMRFRCIEEHTSNNTSFFQDLSKWECISNNGKIINQQEHGFNKKAVVYYSTGTWYQAKADQQNTLSNPPAIIISENNTDYFLIQTNGEITLSSHGLTNNKLYYLSKDTQGQLTETEPTVDEYSNVILKVIDSNTVYIYNHIPYKITDKFYYIHDQISQSQIWNIQHNLKKYPSVTVIDTSNKQIIGDIEYIDNCNITVTFTQQFSGKAFIN